MNKRNLRPAVGLFIFLFTIAGYLGILQPETSAYEHPKKELTKHTVKKGESLCHISRCYNVSIKEIARINKIPNPNKIKTGQVLLIPRDKAKYADSAHSFQWPLKGNVICSYQEKVLGKNNSGINIKPSGSATIYASEEGTVEFSKLLKGHGRLVIVAHPRGFNTVYSNLASSFVKEKELVKARQPIGEAGIDVRTNKIFLHFEIRKDGKVLNPLHFLP
ncbi:peptidoglycan DD-metalloendopeptidase family protein [Candidatus Omnitrophota bacterium]